MKQLLKTFLIAALFVGLGTLTTAVFEKAESDSAKAKLAAAQREDQREYLYMGFAPDGQQSLSGIVHRIERHNDGTLCFNVISGIKIDHANRACLKEASYLLVELSK